MLSVPVHKRYIYIFGGSRSYIAVLSIQISLSLFYNEEEWHSKMICAEAMKSGTLIINPMIGIVILKLDRISDKCSCICWHLNARHESEWKIFTVHTTKLGKYNPHLGNRQCVGLFWLKLIALVLPVLMMNVNKYQCVEWYWLPELYVNGDENHGKAADRRSTKVKHFLFK